MVEAAGQRPDNDRVLDAMQSVSWEEVPEWWSRQKT